MTQSKLNADLLAAHAAADGATLVTLYSIAAKEASDLDAACFFLTHAYVHALELGDPRAAELHRKLARNGREH